MVKDCFCALSRSLPGELHDVDVALFQQLLALADALDHLPVGLDALDQLLAGLAVHALRPQELSREAPALEERDERPGRNASSPLPGRR